MKPGKDTIKVAIVYHCIAHYREPVFRKLCEYDDGIEYTLFSGDSDCIPSLKTIDIEKSKKPVTQGGLRWRIVKNHWLKNKILWQDGIPFLGLKKEYDVIIYLGVVYHISTWVSCILARVAGKKTYMWSHGFLRKETGLKGWLRSAFYSLCNGLLLYHHRARELLIERGFPPEKLDVLYNSLDVDTQKQIRDQIQQSDLIAKREEMFESANNPVLLWIGRLTSQKKLDMIIEAAHLLSDQNFKVNILFVGDGPEKASLEKLVNKYGLQDNVFFYGACHKEEELAPLISLSDVCIAPGEVGLTCMHSLVYGTPVITHDNPDYQMPEYEAIRPGISGVFFNYGNIEDLATSIREWLSRDLSRDEVRKACFGVIDDYYNADKQLKIINNMVRGKPSTLVQKDNCEQPT